MIDSTRVSSKIGIEHKHLLAVTGIMPRAVRRSPSDTCYIARQSVAKNGGPLNRSQTTRFALVVIPMHASRRAGRAVAVPPEQT